jgi:hypothetical protein
VLQNFSSELSKFEFNFKREKEERNDRKLKQHSTVPPITSISRQMSRNKENTYWEPQSKVQEIDKRLAKLESDNTIFSKNYLIKMLLDMPCNHHNNDYSTSPSASYCQPPPCIIQPLFIPIQNTGGFNMPNSPPMTPMTPNFMPITNNYPSYPPNYTSFHSPSYTPSSFTTPPPQFKSNIPPPPPYKSNAPPPTPPPPSSSMTTSSVHSKFIETPPPKPVSPPKPQKPTPSSTT